MRMCVVTLGVGCVSGPGGVVSSSVNILVQLNPTITITLTEGSTITITTSEGSQNGSC